MPVPPISMAQEVARVASAIQRQRTGHAPSAVGVVLSGDTLVITLHGALTPAEQALATDPDGAARVQEFHRQLFASSSEELRKEITRITGVKVREAAAEIEPASGAAVFAFSSGAMIQVFLLAGNLAAGNWGGASALGPDEPTPVPSTPS